jgi:potassium/sodium efflux P-type ATPase
MSTQPNGAGAGAEFVLQRLPENEVYQALETAAGGINREDAEARLHKYGRNTLAEKKGKPLIVRFVTNFTHLMAILLWVGAIVGFVAQMPQLGVAVILVNVINGCFSFFQEFRAEKATEALKKLLPAYARVVRSGEEARVLAEELVPGDVLLLSEGDRVSADCRLVDDNDLKVNQSTLTGESNPVHKARYEVLRDDLTRAEMPNLVFAGTTIASGTGRAVVYATGMQTEFGKIAGLTQSLHEAPSPLQKEMNRITRVVTVMAVSIGVVLFVLAISLAGADLAESFIFALGMIVAFVPEGLLPTVTLSLALGVQRMAKRGALIKKLSSVETLGCTTVICTDKTGTLTQNEMTVSDLWLPGRRFTVTGVGYAPDGKVQQDGKDAAIDPEVRRVLSAAALCTDARLLPPGEESPRYTVLGDPTEAALLVVAQKGGIDLDGEKAALPRLRELPFDSGRKRMSTIHQEGGAQVAFIKGAPREVLELCASVRVNGADQPMDPETARRVMEANDQYASKGLRVLAVAERKLEGALLTVNLSGYTPELIESEMTFLGLIAMADPPRPEVADAVKRCHRAGIRIIMITGDYGLTAESIARRIGIVEGERPRIVTGLELAKMGEQELEEALKGEVIFARVAPEQKLQVVSALQALGHVVAVTGDGVNDSPALKKADIGVAMGISGTDVAKEAAAMILTDDNFASIVNAVEEGRAVYRNIRKFVVYIFNSNMPEAVPFAVYLFSRGAIPLPLTVMQVLSIDLGTDMVPAIALGADLPEKGVMDLPPRSQKEPLLNRRLMLKAFLWYGLIASALAMLGYFFLNNRLGWPGVPLAAAGTNYAMATTMTLAAIVFAQIGAVFAVRTDKLSAFTAGLTSNKLILVGVATEIILISLLMYLPPLHNVFGTAPLGIAEWAFLACVPVVVLALDEARKALMRMFRRA